jgi:hypothetical protein
MKRTVRTSSRRGKSATPAMADTNNFNGVVGSPVTSTAQGTQSFFVDSTSAMCTMSRDERIRTSYKSPPPTQHGGNVPTSVCGDQRRSKSQPRTNQSEMKPNERKLVNLLPSMNKLTCKFKILIDRMAQK